MIGHDDKVTAICAEIIAMKSNYTRENWLILMRLIIAVFIIAKWENKFKAVVSWLSHDHPCFEILDIYTSEQEFFKQFVRDSINGYGGLAFSDTTNIIVRRVSELFNTGRKKAIIFKINATDQIFQDLRIISIASCIAEESSNKQFDGAAGHKDKIIKKEVS